jgi:hypothetical protein
MFKVSPASLQTFIDTPNCVLEDRVHYSTVHIRMYSVMAIFELFKICLRVFLYCNHQVLINVLITFYINRSFCLIITLLVQWSVTRTSVTKS